MTHDSAQFFEFFCSDKMDLYENGAGAYALLRPPCRLLSNNKEQCMVKDNLLVFKWNRRARIYRRQEAIARLVRK